MTLQIRWQPVCIDDRLHSYWFDGAQQLTADIEYAMEPTSWLARQAQIEPRVQLRYRVYKHRHYEWYTHLALPYRQ